MQEVLQILEGLNRKKGIQYIVTSVQKYFNILSKTFGSLSKGRDLCIYYMIKFNMYT